MINPDRAQLIEVTTTQLRSGYDTTSLVGLRRVGDDRDIAVIETSKAIFGISIFHPDYQKWFIFYRRSRFPERSLTMLAHELGHAILEHGRFQSDDLTPSERASRDEEEAIYFADLLVGIEPFMLLHSLVDEIDKWRKHPLISWSYRSLSFNSSFGYALMLFREAGIGPFPLGTFRF